jgi:hypothetical protein
MACEPLGNVETRLRPLRTRAEWRSENWPGRKALPFFLPLHALGTQHSAAPLSMMPSTPRSPEERRRTDPEGMQEHAHLARFGSGTTIPWTRFAERTGATTAHAGGIPHTQAPIGFATPLRYDP